MGRAPAATPARPRTRSLRAASRMRARPNGRGASRSRWIKIPREHALRRAGVRRTRRLGAACGTLGRGWACRHGLAVDPLLAPFGAAPRRTVLAAIDPHALDPARVGVEHLDLERAGARNEPAAHRP